jgi:hypothetical protein
LGILKKQIKAVCDISDVTINKCCKKLEAVKWEFLPTMMLEKYGLPLPVPENTEIQMEASAPPK